MQDQTQRLASLQKRIVKILKKERADHVFGHRDTGWALGHLFKNGDPWLFQRMTVGLMAAFIRKPEFTKEVELIDSHFNLSNYLERLTHFFTDLNASQSFELYYTLITIDSEFPLDDMGIKLLEEKCDALERA